MIDGLRGDETDSEIEPRYRYIVRRVSILVWISQDGGILRCTRHYIIKQELGLIKVLRASHTPILSSPGLGANVGGLLDIASCSS